MHIAKVKLESLSPYGQGRQYDKEEVPMLDKERPDDYERRTWYHRAHWDDQGRMFIPPSAFKNGIAECAKYLSMQIPGKGKATFTKHFEAGVLVVEPVVLPVKKVDGNGKGPAFQGLTQFGIYVPSDGRRGGTKRVKKFFPMVPAWNGEVTFHILDETITEEVFRHHVEQMGQFIGVGVYRPRNNGYWGRFKVVSIRWE